jgi:hypothetical protein
MTKIIVSLFVLNIFYFGIVKGQNNDESVKAIYDTCLKRHVNYWMSYSNKSNWTDSIFIVNKDENYKGSQDVKVDGATIKYLTEGEIYKLSSKGIAEIIRFSSPIIIDSSIIISIIDFTVKKKKKHQYDFTNHGGSKHTIRFNCQTEKFEVVSSKESRP